MPLLTLNEIRSALPQVGDKLYKTPTLGKSLGFSDMEKPQECVVTFVHQRHLWFQVQFPTGVKECYKLPTVRVAPNGVLMR